MPTAPRDGYADVEVPVRSTRPLYVRKEDIHTHGPTPKCRGCLTVIQGRPYSKPHTEECRTRFKDILTETEAGRRRVERTESRFQDAVVREFEAIMGDDNNDEKDLKESKKKRRMTNFDAAPGGAANDDDRERSTNISPSGNTWQERHGTKGKRCHAKPRNATEGREEKSRHYCRRN